MNFSQKILYINYKMKVLKVQKLKRKTHERSYIHIHQKTNNNNNNK